MIAPRWIKVFRDLWDNKSRTLLIVFSIAIGVFAFGGLFIARDIAIASQRTQWEESNPADITLKISGFDDTLVAWAAHQPHVTAARGSASYTATLLSKGVTHTLNLYAFSDFDDASVNRVTPETGDWPPGLDAFVIERSYAGRLGLEPGETVTIELSDGQRHHLKYAGQLHDIGVRSGTFQPQIAGYVSLETLHRIGLPATYNQLDIRVERLSDSGAPVPAPAEIADTLRDDLRRMGVHIGSVSVNEDGKRWSDDSFDGLTTILVTVGLASLLLSAFLVVNTISGLMAQQKRQIGVMKIIGASRGQIIGVYLALVASFGALALVIALPASVLLAYGLAEFIGPHVLNFDILDFHLPTYILILEVVVAFLTPLLSALFPILGGTRIPAAQAISDFVVPGKHGVIDTLLARLSGFSTPLLLSIRNTFRRKVRLFITALTLTLAGAFFISILNVRNGLNVNLNRFLQMSEYDVQMVFAEPYNAQGLMRMVSEQPGVAAVESWTSSGVSYTRSDGTEGDEFSLIGLPADSQFIDPPLLTGRWLSPLDYANRYDIVITDDLQTDMGVSVGDSVTLERGHDSHQWRVVGVVDGGASLAYSYYETVARFDQTPDLADRVSIRTSLSGNESQKILTEQLTDYFTLKDIEVRQSTSRVETIATLTGAFNILIVILMAMAILIAVVASLGLTGTMSLNVMERTREIGVMRAVGAGNGDIRRVYVGEGVMIGLLSCVVAVPLSLPVTALFGNLLGQIIFQQPLAFEPLWTAIGIWLAIVLIVSTLASIAPAQRASQISIREAIAYE